MFRRSTALDARSPLLPARHAKRPPRRGSAPGAAGRSGRQRVRWLISAVLLLLVGFAVLLYRRALLAVLPETGAEEAQRDSEAELQLLHEQPSEAFCALPPPLVCAHGGDTAAAPPNTAAAFAAALAGGARCVEVDVARTKDGQLVVLHMRELSHLLKLAGKAAPKLQQQGRGRGSKAHPPQPQVGDFTWADLSALRWEGGEGVELVEAVVRQVARGTDQITLDVKTYSQAGEEVDEDVMAQAVVDLVHRTACTHCLVWAKSDVVVRLVKEIHPTQRVGYVVLNETAAARAAGMHRLLRMPGAEVIALHFAMASVEVTQKARAARKQVHAWTANTAGMMRAVLDAGVDAVVTNHPRKLAEAVESRVQRCGQQQRQQQHRQLQGEQRQGQGQQRQGQAGSAAGSQAQADGSLTNSLQEGGEQQQGQQGQRQPEQPAGQPPRDFQPP